MPPQPGESVIWIKVTKPTFDLVGVLLSSLGLTTILAAVAIVLGTAFGLSLILRRRREALGHVFDAVSLDLHWQGADPARTPR